VTARRNAGDRRSDLAVESDRLRELVLRGGRVALAPLEQRGRDRVELVLHGRACFSHYVVADEHRASPMKMGAAGFEPATSRV
jgi:hypothetical protein